MPRPASAKGLTGCAPAPEPANPNEDEEDEDEEDEDEGAAAAAEADGAEFTSRGRLEADRTDSVPVAGSAMISIALPASVL